jgi:hypothetical protein
MEYLTKETAKWAFNYGQQSALLFDTAVHIIREAPRDGNPASELWLGRGKRVMIKKINGQNLHPAYKITSEHYFVPLPSLCDDIRAAVKVITARGDYSFTEKNASRRNFA